MSRAHATAEVIEVILSPSDRHMQTIRKAPSYKPVDNLGVNSDRYWTTHALVFDEWKAHRLGFRMHTKETFELIF